MPLSQEIYQSIYGAWRIARFDPDAMRYFNLSLQGFWRSFIAALLLAPLSLITKLVNDSGVNAERLPDGAAGNIYVWLIVWTLSWALFPIIMVPLARLLDLAGTYVSFIIAWNWSQVLIAGVVYPLSILRDLGALGDAFGGTLMIMAWLSVSFYAYLVTRVSLQSNLPTAIGIVIMEILLSLLVLVSVYQLAYGAMPV
jgi:hypothetical protein